MTTLTKEQIDTIQVQVRHDNLQQRLNQLAVTFDGAGDDGNAAKMRELIQKLDGGQFAIGFCGHFSAGKSSMINALLGSEILPSSPIPTSANVVAIRGGEVSKATAYLTNGETIDFDVAKDLEKIKNYAADGNLVERIDIAHPTDLLTPNVSVMDTPGIDSTDDAHKVATESALHLADVVLYVMDYNHVQSELNFSFTKTLKDRGKPVYLVVNMIDKHMDFELSFDDYRESVIEGFATWGIEPDGLYFTSLFEPDHEENMFEALQEKIGALFAEKDELLVKSVVSSAAYLIDEHRKTQAKENAEHRRRYEAVIDAADNVEDLLEAARTAQEKLDRYAAAPAELEQRMRKEIQSLLDNAKITPFQTTELAGAYLQSRKPGFKVGFLFGSTKKTEEERAARLAALAADLRDKVQANIDWHIRELLVKIPEEAGVRDEAYAKAVYDGYAVSYDEAFIAGVVKEGGLSSEEYMYQFAKDLSAAVKELYRHEAMRFVTKAVEAVRAKESSQGEELRAQVAAAQEIIEAQAALAGLAEREEKYLAELLGLLIGEEK
ncbi:dynamin family protein [Tumebacillus sp. DT12]|uniref:Dynamin family protein n=1 Tax=Tumebacillus lacus TaxID=2995335 RepID=A0ABT3X2Y5_9BACL|nr:dynamin family protein [Tumebacillus lacus]MCX7571265.1 dynamin family protein [Tumebacillus lacus]